MYKTFNLDNASILFGDFDFSLLNQYVDPASGKLYLAKKSRKKSQIIIDEYTYSLITNYIRKMHGMKKYERIPANESTKKILIEDAKEEYLINQCKEQHSFLKNLISSMVNSEGFKFNHYDVWNMNINAFLDSVERIKRIKSSTLLLQSGYSGFGINLEKINN